jgi:hypothetical protein
MVVSSGPSGVSSMRDTAVPGTLRNPAV